MPTPFKMTNWLENVLANFLLRGVNYSFPSTVYLGLLDSFTEAGDGSSFSEVAGSAYTRRAIAWDAPSGGATQNSATITFPMATSNWGGITNFGVFDALSGGNMMYWGVPQAVLTCDSGEQLEFTTGEIDLAVTGNLTTALANNVINMTVRNTPMVMPTAWYAALLSSFTSDVSYSEVVDGAYVRQAISFSAPSNGITSNSGNLLYPAANGSFSVAQVAVFNAISGGTMLLRGPLPTPKAVVATQQFQFLAGDLEAAFD